MRLSFVLFAIVCVYCGGCGVRSARPPDESVGKTTWSVVPSARSSPSSQQTPEGKANAYFDKQIGNDQALIQKVNRRYDVAQQHVIFEAACLAEDREDNEQFSERVHPELKPNLQEQKRIDALYYRVRNKYTGSVARKYRLTIAEVDAIKVEGGDHHWPLPVYPDQK